MSYTFLTPDKWVEKYFPGGGPGLSTVRRWAQGGKIAARKIGGAWVLFDLPPGEFPQESGPVSPSVEEGRAMARAFLAEKRGR